jgi:hypothetical protein
MAGSDSESQGDNLMGELLGVLPRLLDRTQRQVAFSARTISHLPCLGWLLGSPPPDTEVPPHEAPQPADVLSVIADKAPRNRSEVPSKPEPRAPTLPAAAEEPAEAIDVPDVESLPIPGYESLAASQVIPRLAALSPEELRAVGAYERSTRRRQTILHRVAQLLPE